MLPPDNKPVISLRREAQWKSEIRSLLNYALAAASLSRRPTGGEAARLLCYFFFFSPPLPPGRSAGQPAVSAVALSPCQRPPASRPVTHDSSGSGGGGGGDETASPHAAAALMLYKYLLQRAETVASAGPGHYGLVVVVADHISDPFFLPSIPGTVARP